MHKTPKFINLKEQILRKIKAKGGWVNAHAHLDRAYTLSNSNQHDINATLQEKWLLNDSLKKNSTVNQIYDRMAYALENLISQGVCAVGSFIDVDEIVKDKAIKASQKIKDRYGKKIKLKFINQTLKEVIDKEAYKWFKIGADYVDILGGLPGKDKGQEEKHLEIILNTAKDLKKMIHVHVDQLNTTYEKETELLVKKTLESKMIGQVVAIHGISISAQKKSYRMKLYQHLKKAKISLICCPSAWIDSRRTEILSPTHNAVTPIDEMIPVGIKVALGSDNIIDIYKPFSDGDMWSELRFILESCHYYNIDKLVEMATINGLKVLGIK